ncbi:HAD family hydrolase [Clostridium polynesiense]|uniref:HAD family hydrolase n=1 Tax=Clostridium polynesiense TaxID=1325933 RepID=UPI00058F5740|nr:HAD family phosphatase [Clostridium polynesiense]
MNNVKLVIFDMDGLMLDTERLAIDASLRAAKEKGYEVKKEYLIETIGCNEKDSLVIMKGHLGQDFPWEEVRTHTRKLFEEALDREGVPLKEGLIDLLDFIDEKGIAKVVATSTSRNRAEKLLASAGILDRFDDMICGDEVEKGKPEPEIFLKACKKANAAPEESIILEDSINGLLAASRAGIRCVLIPDLIEPTKENEALAYAKVKNLLEVMKLEF